MHKHCVRQIKMSPQEWERLEQLAHDTYSAARVGRKPLQVTWLALIRRIARGELLVVEAEQRHQELKARLDEIIAQQGKEVAPVPATAYRQLSILESEPA